MSRNNSCSGCATARFNFLVSLGASVEPPKASVFEALRNQTRFANLSLEGSKIFPVSLNTLKRRSLIELGTDGWTKLDDLRRQTVRQFARRSRASDADPTPHLRKRQGLERQLNHAYRERAQLLRAYLELLELTTNNFKTQGSKEPLSSLTRHKAKYANIFGFPAERRKT